jgi:hypothetical protein
MNILGINAGLGLQYDYSIYKSRRGISPIMAIASSKDSKTKSRLPDMRKGKSSNVLSQPLKHKIDIRI